MNKEKFRVRLAFAIKFFRVNNWWAEFFVEPQLVSAEDTMKLKITIFSADGKITFPSTTKIPSECRIEMKEVSIVSSIFKSQLTLPRKLI